MMPRDLLQHEVADRMATRVVDLLEVIEIDRGDGDGGASAPRLTQIGAQLRLERPAVQAARERIAADLLGEPRMHRLEAAREQREFVGPAFAAAAAAARPFRPARRRLQ